MRTNVIKLLRKYKVVIIALLLIILIIILIFSNRESDSQTDPSPSTPQAQGQFSDTLFVVSRQPESSTFSSPWSVEPITFTFNKNVKPETFKYNIEPEEQTKTDFDYTTPNQISIIPLFGWKTNQEYTITIYSLESTTGKKITEPVKTTFTRTFDPADLPEVSE